MTCCWRFCYLVIKINKKQRLQKYPSVLPLLSSSPLSLRLYLHLHIRIQPPTTCIHDYIHPTSKFFFGKKISFNFFPKGAWSLGEKQNSTIFLFPIRTQVWGNKHRSASPPPLQQHWTFLQRINAQIAEGAVRLDCRRPGGAARWFWIAVRKREQFYVQIQVVVGGVHKTQILSLRLRNRRWGMGRRDNLKTSSSNSCSNSCWNFWD
jgi:hypothetical protein